MEQILEPLLQSPRLPEYVEQLEKVLAEEKKKRHDFYEWLNEDNKAEFINGEVVDHSPARSIHIAVLQQLQFRIFSFVKQNNLGVVFAEQALIRLNRMDVMPDLSFWRKETSDTFQADTTIFPAPDFVVEILSKATEKNDRTIKKEAYAADGVKEYWLIDPDNKKIEQYILKNDDYELKEKLSHGTVQCYILQGLEIPLSEIFG